MAFQSHGREPLIDAALYAQMQKRGTELLGLGGVVLGLCVAALLFSYTPSDPSWLSATDKPVQNLMGRTGASIAAPLVLILGMAAWALPALLLTWGGRLMRHMGQDRALSRLTFAPIAIAVTSLFAAALPPAGFWVQSFGMGGLFGDTGLGLAISLMPVDQYWVLVVMALALGVAFIGLTLLTLGFTKSELVFLGRMALIGIILIYSLILRAFGKGSAKAAAKLHHLANARKTPPLQENPVIDDDPFEMQAAPVPHPLQAKAKGKSLLGWLAPAPEAPATQDIAEDAADITEDSPLPPSLRARIKDAVRAKQTGAAPVVTAPAAATTSLRAEPVLQDPETPQPSLAFDPQDDWADDADDLLEDEPPQFTTPAPSLPIAEPRKVVQPAAIKPIQPSTRARAEAEPSLGFEDASGDGFELPPLGLLRQAENFAHYALSEEALEENARMLETVLDDYGVKGEIVSVRPGPVVTMYELEPAPGLKASRVVGLADDIARSMAALSARVSTVPGRSVIGIELPNENREMVSFREILSARDFGDGKRKLALALGKDISGAPVVADLAKMPHLLIAGTTGSGKSVAINTMILSLLYKLTPDDCRMIMIDPKMLELSVYDGIPHLLSPVVTDPKKAVVALKWVVGEMEDRYRKMSKMGVRNIDGYNSRVAEALAKGENFSRTVQTGFDDDTGEPVFETEEFTPTKLPYIVVVVDEMADLMMVAGKEIEACIQRLAQMARASGIHLIMATQRPSVDVITGTIKANFPTRISFQVTSKIDSRTILGEMGAEQLLGMGDMLYMAGGSRISRCHGPFVSDEEVEEVVTHLKSFGPPEYVGNVVSGPDEDKADSIDMVLGLGGNTDGEDALYDTAVAIVIKDRKCSTSYIQRKLAIGYNKAARLVEQMEDQGVVSPANHVGKREVLVPEGTGG
jgi:S-DNA-T family DNA segregation ATPase FtsK/SpoIIIE